MKGFTLPLLQVHVLVGSVESGCPLSLCFPDKDWLVMEEHRKNTDPFFPPFTAPGI